MVGSTLRKVEKGTFMADLDIGEMFLNFMLSKEVRLFCGVVAMNVRKKEEWEKDRPGGWERWESKIMGLTYLTYDACQSVM